MNDEQLITKEVDVGDNVGSAPGSNMFAVNMEGKLEEYRWSFMLRGTKVIKKMMNNAMDGIHPFVHNVMHEDDNWWRTRMVLDNEG